MKSLPKLLAVSAFLAVIGCGKNNTSGTTSTPLTCMTQGVSGCSAYQGGLVYQSGYSYGGVSLDQVQVENPCILGASYGTQTNLARTPVTTQINIGSIVTAGDIYVGVTSYGDVAAIVGNGTSSPTFVAYLCPRPVAPASGPVSTTIGAYTNCTFKYITASTIAFQDGSKALFRALSPGGSSMGQKFSFCQQ